MMDTVYVCNRCGETFSLEEGYSLHTNVGDVTLCPVCRSDDLEEGRRCKVCREIHYTFDLTNGVCKDCFADAVDAYKSAINSLMGWEREVLEDEYGSIDVTEKE